MFGRRVPRPSENFIAHILALSSLTLIAMVVLGLGHPQANEVHGQGTCTTCSVRAAH
jgi:hypothetical protein